MLLQILLVSPESARITDVVNVKDQPHMIVFVSYDGDGMYILRLRHLITGLPVDKEMHENELIRVLRSTPLA